MTIGLAVAAVAGYVLLTSGPISGGSGTGRPTAGGAGTQPEPGHDEISQESRQQLLEILREADGEEQ